MKYILYVDQGYVTMAMSGEDGFLPEEIDGQMAIEATVEDFHMYVSLEKNQYLKYDSMEHSFSKETNPEHPALINKTSIVADGVDTAVISGLINPSDVTVVGINRYIVDDRVFEFSIDTPGIYIIKVWSSRYLEKEFTVNAS